MVYLLEKFEVSSVWPSMSQEHQQSLERGGLERGGVWRLDEILPAAVDDLMSACGGIAAASGVAALDSAQRAVQGDELPRRSRSPWIAAPMLDVGLLESPASATIGSEISVF